MPLMIELPADEYRDLVAQIAREISVRRAPAAAASVGSLAAMIESTLLRPDTTAAGIDQLCEDAARYGFAAVCVNPVWIARAAARLHPTPVRVVAVVGFPLGANGAAVKQFEAAECLKLGADELDVVLDIGGLKAGADAAVEAELAAIVQRAHAAGAAVKAILELPLLNEEEKARAARFALAAGADFLKTSTGFLSSRAVTVEDVALLRTLAQGRAGIKAAGGIRTLVQAQALAAAGATRLGTSSAAAILAES